MSVSDSAFGVDSPEDKGNSSEDDQLMVVDGEPDWFVKEDMSSWADNCEEVDAVNTDGDVGGDEIQDLPVGDDLMDGLSQDR